VDLGAGRGATLRELVSVVPDAVLVAVDLDADALAAARDMAAVRAVRHDLANGLPFATGAVDVVLSHNTLEWLLDPAALLVEVARVLRPDGRAVLGHTDFESLVVSGADRDLTRRLLLTYAELPVRYQYMAAADGQLGRRLPGLVRRAPLRLESVEAHTAVVPALTGAAARRLAEVAAVARRCAARGVGHVATAEVDDWERQLLAAADGGTFLFAETAFVVLAVPR
jgi:SAM-dependent methyltransferase